MEDATESIFAEIYRAHLIFTNCDTAMNFKFRYSFKLQLFFHLLSNFIEHRICIKFFHEYESVY